MTGAQVVEADRSEENDQDRWRAVLFHFRRLHKTSMLQLFPERAGRRFLAAPLPLPLMRRERLYDEWALSVLPVTSAHVSRLPTI